jgi:hypothetical protein
LIQSGLAQGMRRIVTRTSRMVMSALSGIRRAPRFG